MSSFADEPAGEPAPAEQRPRGRVSGFGFRLESALIGIVLSVGIVAIGVILGAILVGQDVDGWIVGLVVAIVSVLLSSILWSSRQR